MHTLVVEDDPAMRLLFESLLRARGHTVASYGEAEPALEAYEREHHPLVLLDWMLEGMDGLELCRRMRALPQGSTSVILLITARNQTEDLLSALEAGADDYLAKPLSAELLLVRLLIAERLVRTRAAKRETQRKLDETMVALGKTQADLLLILSSLKVGTALTDENGHVTFLNPLASQLLGLHPTEGIGSRWMEVFPFEEQDKQLLLEMSARPMVSRSNLPVHLETPQGVRYWMEAEVQDDPRDPRRHIFFFYDVTEVHDLRQVLNTRSQFQAMVGRSEPMQRVFQHIRDVAAVDTTVLIEGETGTGKELVARAIHDASHRRAKPFIAVNCAGLTDSLLTSQLFGHRKGAFTGATHDHEGLFESANEGTIFLDEIGDIPMNVQTSLLRVLQEREVTRVGENRPRKIDVRVLCATHRELAQEVTKGTFRADLLYRIRVARVSLPALRLRKEDIPILVGSFLNQFRATLGKKVAGVETDAMRAMMAYSWPGNVRELRSAVEFAVIRCKGSILQLADLPSELQSSALPQEPGHFGPEAPAPESTLSLKDRIAQALAKAKGNRTEAARLMGVSRATFYRQLDRLESGLDPV